MPSFDISSKVDAQLLDNAVNVAYKEIANRYDFKGAHALLELDKKSLTIKTESDSEMKLKQIEEVLLSKAMKQGIDAKAFNFDKEPVASGKYVRKEIAVSNGIDREQAKTIVKLIKDSKLKVQASIMDDIIRVTGKKIDDLQEVIQACKNGGLNLPLQFINMKN